MIVGAAGREAANDTAGGEASTAGQHEQLRNSPRKGAGGIMHALAGSWNRHNAFPQLQRKTSAHVMRALTCDLDADQPN